MLIHIDDTTIVADIQERFSDSFPRLKIEFYDESLQDKQTPLPRISSEEQIGFIRRLHNVGELEILSWYSTGRVERDFKEKFGLNVQVFRRENGAWIQSRATDSATLAEQMERARQSAVSFPKRRRQVVEYEYF